MPIYEYKCPSCSYKTERLFKADARPHTAPCKVCGKEASYCVSKLAKTPYGWGDSAWHGYDRGLGVKLWSKEQREMIMKARGLREVSQDELQKDIDRDHAEAIEHDRTVKRYEAALRENNGDKGLALVDTFPVTEADVGDLS